MDHNRVSRVPGQDGFAPSSVLEGRSHFVGVAAINQTDDADLYALLLPIAKRSSPQVTSNPGKPKWLDPLPRD